jgi:hypothetical protein
MIKLFYVMIKLLKLIQMMLRDILINLCACLKKFMPFLIKIIYLLLGKNYVRMPKNVFKKLLDLIVIIMLPKYLLFS